MHCLGCATTPTGKALDPFELALALAVVSVATAAWFALVAATFGLFAGPVGALFSIVAGAGVAVAVARRLLRGASVARPTRVELAVGLTLLALTAAILGRPHEYVLGGRDPGVYVNTAALIADEGSVVWQDGALAMLPDDVQLALFREPRSQFVQGSRLIGFYIVDLSGGRSVPHGVHLFPAAIAIGYALAGLQAALFVPPLLAGLAVGAVGLLARRLAGPAAGVVAVLVLALNPAEGWFGRYPAAETAVQAFLFGGLLLLVLAIDRQTRTAAWLAGACIGLSHLAKIETVVVPVGVGLVVGWLWLTGRATRVHGAFVFGYAVLLGHAVLHAGLIATHYTVDAYGRALSPGAALAAVATAAVLLAVVLVRPRQLVGGATAVERHSGRLWWLVAALTALLLGFGWLVRPLDLFGELGATPEAVRFMTRNRLEALPRLTWYLPSLALLAAVAGALLAARRWPPLAIVLVLVLFPLEALLVLSDARITADYPWAARRWVGILIPSAALFAGACVAWLPGLIRPAIAVRAGVAFAGMLAVAMVGLSVVASAPLLRHRELAGSAALVRQIAARIDPVGVVMLDDDLVGWRFSAPLQFLAGRSAFIPFGDAGKDDGPAQALSVWQDAERPLYWLRHGEPARFDRWGRRWEPVERWLTSLPEVAPTIDAPARDVRVFTVPVTLYRATR